MDHVITIDGPAGSGKSTISRLLAKRLNRLYLDTGAMYRAVALAAKRKGIDTADTQKLGELCRSLDIRFKADEDPPRLFMSGEDISMAIRSPEMDLLASTVSSVKAVREAMVALQRKMSEGAALVAEGRDMGTVVFVDAEHKFFLTASPEIRAERRYEERRARGEAVSLHTVKREMTERDGQDQERSISPLTPAKDAIIIDSTDLTPEQVVQEIMRHIHG
jgi:cytidylate kinase